MIAAGDVLLLRGLRVAPVLPLLLSAHNLINKHQEQSKLAWEARKPRR